MSYAFGLNHTLEELDDVFQSIHLKSIEEQSEYVDGICKAMCLNDEFVKDQMNSSRQKQSFELWNTTSVGNCAYMALHCNDENARKYYKDLLEQYKQYRTLRVHLNCVIL